MKPKSIPFADNLGRIYHVPADRTLAELVRDGIKFDLVPAGTPLPDGWIKPLPEPPAATPE